MTSYLSYSDLMNRTNYSRSQIWRKSRDPNDPFPVPRKLGGNKVGWVAEEYEAWEKSRPQAYTQAA